ncbi:MAG: hypothetical protein ABL909_11160 [Sphingopyxis sp.]
MRAGPVDIATFSFFTSIMAGLVMGLSAAAVPLFTSSIQTGFYEFGEGVFFGSFIGAIIGLVVIWPVNLIAMALGIILARIHHIFALRAAWLISGAVIGGALIVIMLDLSLSLIPFPMVAALGAVLGAITGYINHVLLSASTTRSE